MLSEETLGTGPLCGYLQLKSDLVRHKEKKERRIEPHA